LLDNACTVYPDRPGVCRAYPTLYKEGFVRNLGITFSNCSVCPIVYNVYELVKMEIRESQATALLPEGE
jgi:Fe-S-cluster containining protein